MAKLNVKSTNQKSLPYNLTNDLVRIKVEVKKGINPSYNNGITITMYANFGPDASTVTLGTTTTDEFGVANFTFSTNLIDNKKIDTAEYWASINVNGKTIYSNKTITNYIHDESIFFGTIIIDANTTSSRLNSPDDYNMVDANTTTARAAYPDEYLIINRSEF